MKTFLLMVLLGLTGLANAQGFDGKAVYARNCAACHQASGGGVSGAFPALSDNAFVQGDPAAVISTVLKGRGGMPTFAESHDAEIAVVITYIRHTWGNRGSPVSEKEVQSVRSKSGIAEAANQVKMTNIH